MPLRIAPSTHLSGANANAANHDGAPPLEVAAYCEHADLVRLLLAHGAADLGPERPNEARAYVDTLKAADRAAAASQAAPSASATTVPSDPEQTSAFTSRGASCVSAATPTPATALSLRASPAGPSTCAAPDPGATPLSGDVSAALGTLSLAPDPPPSAPKLSLAPAPPPPAPKLCAHCGAAKSATVKLSKCSLCQAVRYCSADCQNAHWRQGGHKRQCKVLRAGVSQRVGAWSCRSQIGLVPILVRPGQRTQPARGRGTAPAPRQSQVALRTSHCDVGLGVGSVWHSDPRAPPALPRRQAWPQAACHRAQRLPRHELKRAWRCARAWWLGPPPFDRGLLSAHVRGLFRVACVKETPPSFSPSQPGFVGSSGEGSRHEQRAVLREGVPEQGYTSAQWGRRMATGTPHRGPRGSCVTRR